VGDWTGEGALVTLPTAVEVKAVTESTTTVDSAPGEPEREWSWFIRAKLAPPAHQVRLVSREHLLMSLDRLSGKRLGLLVAPAGFGKTTLLMQWQARQRLAGSAVAWLTLDEGDGNLHQFASYSVLALASAGVDLGSLEAAAEQGMVGGALRQTLSVLLERIGAHRSPIVLILDDYHRLGAPGVDRFLTELISMAPSNFTVVVSSRVRLSLDVPRLMAGGLAMEFDAEFLRLTREELADAFDRPLTHDEVDFVFGRTEGWFVAVQLARLLIREGDSIHSCLQRFTGDSGHVANYLAEQVLSNLEAPLLSFLVRTSILESVCAPLADAVLVRSDSLEMLRRLQPLNALLVPLSEMPGWYRFHHLFAECLQDILSRRHGAQIPELHLRAADWFERQGNVSETVYHAGAARNFDRCAALIQEAGGWELILFGGIGHLRNLLCYIPAGVLRRYPRLQIAKAYLSAKDGDLAETRALFNSARAREHDAGASVLLERDLLNVGALLEIYEDRHMRPADLLALKTQIDRHPLEDPMSVAILTCQYVLACIALGRFLEAEQHAQEVIRVMRQARTVLGLNYCFLHAGLAALYQGKLDVAEAHFGVARSMAEENFASDPGLRALSGVLHATLRYWQGRLDEEDSNEVTTFIDYVEAYDGWFELYANALQVECSLPDKASAALSRARRIAAVRGLERLELLTDIEELRRSEPGKLETLARRVLVTMPKGIWSRDPFQWRPFVESRLALARFYMEVDRPQAIAMATAAYECAFELQAVPFLIDSLIVRAQLRNFVGERAAAIEDLRHALSLAAPERICGPFERERGLAPLLRAVVKASRSDFGDVRLLAFAESLATRTARISPAAVSSNGLQFSSREFEVLEELLQGNSNKEIARVLDMTEHTVKFHLKHIFAKLNVERRAQAVAKARELGLG
jgi:LuxR family transcriptional regulator, maltose regulon positive regulatory protein